MLLYRVKYQYLYQKTQTFLIAQIGLDSCKWKYKLVSLILQFTLSATHIAMGNKRVTILFLKMTERVLWLSQVLQPPPLVIQHVWS